MPARRLDALDGLRGAAALTVVVYHAMGRSDWFRDGMYQFRADGLLAGFVTMSPVRILFDGRAAVMAFFVLSGFVLSRAFWSGKATSWGRYLVRRGLRLYPPVVASAVFALVVLGLTQTVTETGRGFVDLGVIGSSSSELFTAMGLLGLSESPLNVVWWSLRWEMWFSLLLPVIVVALVLAGCGPRRRFRAAPVVFGAVCIALVVAQPWIRVTYGTSPTVSRAIAYLPMFGLGMVVAAFEDRFGPERMGSFGRWRGSAWTLLGVTLVLLSSRSLFGWAWATQVIRPEIAAGLAAGAPLVGFALLIVLLIGWPVAGRVMASRPILWVGERSYSLYLVHLPLIGLLAAVFSADGAPIWFVIVCVAASVGVTVAFYRFVEVPSTLLASRLGRRPTARATTAVGEDAGGPASLGSPVLASVGGSTDRDG